MRTHQQTDHKKQNDNDARNKRQSIPKLWFNQIHNIRSDILQQAIGNPRTARPEMLLQLQRICGNQYLGRMIAAANKPVGGIPSFPKRLPQVITAGETVGPGRVQEKSGNTYIQRTIDSNTVTTALYESDQLPPLMGMDATNKQKMRNHEEAKMLFEELKLRYPGNPPEPLVVEVIANLNKKPVITYMEIRQEITNIELKAGLTPTQPPVPQSETPMQGFIRHITDRRGAYVWAGGTSKYFKALADGKINNLPNNAQINCWEAVFFSAAKTGLVDIRAFQEAYKQPEDNRADEVFRVITKLGPTREIALPQPENAENGIQAGDIIMLEGASGPLSHVVVAVEPNHRNIHDIVVMSLWDPVGGGSFAKTKLDNLIAPHITTIRYTTIAPK